MNSDELLSSFLQILQCVSLENVLIDSNVPLKIVLAEQVDCLDFEQAVICFEVTHRLVLDYDDLTGADFERLTVEQLIANHLVTESRELLDPLFVTRQFCAYRDALHEILERGEDGSDLAA